MKKNIKYIILLIVGIIFLGFNAFHGNIWYDESYSMAIIQHGFADVWKLTSLDVHPPLYYIMLKIFTMIFGYSITIARIFSVIGALLLASIGFTHLRKMFNDKIGFLFSFLTIFLPATLSYAIEIRMYTWVAYFVALAAIYAYKFYLNQNKKLLIPLTIFSVLAAYTHYYGLLIIAIINLFLLVYSIKNNKNKKFMILTVVAEAILYAPWILFFLFAAIRVSFGFWIDVNFNTILNEIITFVFCATKENTAMKYTIIIAYPIIFFTIYKMINLKSKEMTISFKVLLTTIFVALAVSYFRPLFITRYLFPMIGLIIFMIAYAISTISNKRIFIALLAIILLFSIHNFYVEFQKDYDPLNNEVKTYINNQLEPSDIIVSVGVGDLTGTASIMFPNNKCYFFNSEAWSADICDTFPNMDRLTDLNMFDNYHGKVWVISPNDTNFYDSINNPNKKLLEEPKYFNRPAFVDEFYIYLFEIP